MKLSHSLRQRMWGVAVLVAAMTASAPALAQKVLVLGDTSVTTHAVNSSDYWNAAIKEMKAAVDQPLPAPSNVTSIGAINTTDLLPTQLRQPNGDPYDVIVVTAVFGGVTANNRTLLQQAIQNRSAGAFFLFPDQCSSCAANVADITIPFVNAATGWGVTGGTNKTGAETVNLNTNSVAQASFTSFPTLAVNDYTDINNVPVNNALYMRLGAPIPPANPNINDLSFRTDHAAAVIVPRSQSYNGNGACIFVISDVNTLVNGTSPTCRIPDDHRPAF